MTESAKWRRFSGKKPKKISKLKNNKVVSSHSHISDMYFDQKSQQPPKEGVWRRHRPTDRHRNSMTESVQWANSVKITLNYFLLDNGAGEK